MNVNQTALLLDVATGEGRPWDTIKADIDVPQGGAEGVIVGEGGRFYGYALIPVEGQASVHV
jgi:hypothetical protein